jgi:hypothetical protein
VRDVDAAAGRCGRGAGRAGGRPVLPLRAGPRGKGSGSGPEPGLACAFDLAWHDADGRLQPWPEDDAAQTLWLPRPLWLALYRISQEALTNVARHAAAENVEVVIQPEPGGFCLKITDDGREMLRALGFNL